MSGTISLHSYTPLPEGAHQYGLVFIQSNKAVKLREEEQLVTVGAVDPGPELAGLLQDFHRKEVSLLHIDSAEFSAFLGRLMAGGSSEVALDAKASVDNLDLEALASDAPVINLVNSICIEAIRAGASDIHIESFAHATSVRYRVDGVLCTAQTLPAERFPALASRIKVMAGLNLMERRRPQDGRISVNLAGRSVDIRVSCVPTAAAPGAESIVLRLFNNDNAAFTLEDLGLPEDCLLGISELLASPHGMILVTGPTGSGKTTTLNAMVRKLNGETDKIITIEDPVEYRIDGITQIQTDDKIGLTFSSLLRRILRQDPNVILIGEIRDAETAELAVRAALTGHLVLSSLHTNDAVSAVSRLADLGVEPFLIGAVLRGVIAQRLTRRLCPSCAAEVTVQEYALRAFRSAGLPTITREYTPVGCSKCADQGYRGRLAAVEFFISDPRVSSLISSGSDDSVSAGISGGLAYDKPGGAGAANCRRGLIVF